MTSRERKDLPWILAGALLIIAIIVVGALIRGQ